MASGFGCYYEGWAGKAQLRSGRALGGFSLNGTIAALWTGKEPGSEVPGMRQFAVVQTLKGIGPKDPLESILAAQMVATHEAAMECCRRTHLPEQSFEGSRRR